MKSGDGVALVLAACALSACGGGATAPDAGGDAQPSGDAADGGATYHDISDQTFWAVFDLTTVDPNAHGYAGGAFDGRYVYFAPKLSLVARLDTTADFAAGASWSTFDTKTVSPNASSFLGAAFDGRYVYLVPGSITGGNQGSLSYVTRYDTQADFGSASSWSTFDTTNVDVNASNFRGATFDGRYVYLIPFSGSGTFLRYDTQASFTASSSWSELVVSGAGFAGGVFDGRYVYAISGSCARYDTQAPFTAASSWSTMSYDPGGEPFFGGAFDGRYVYLAPWSVTASTVTRYDTTAPFTTASSWSKFDALPLVTVNGGQPGAVYFAGGAFDGRYVYFVPDRDGVTDPVVTRYDTGAAFTSASSWSTFDPQGRVGNVDGFAGAVFDGRYLYFPPAWTGAAARFDARTPPSMPPLPAFFGSFF